MHKNAALRNPTNDFCLNMFGKNKWHKGPLVCHYTSWTSLVHYQTALSNLFRQLIRMGWSTVSNAAVKNAKAQVLDPQLLKFILNKCCLVLCCGIKKRFFFFLFQLPLPEKVVCISISSNFILMYLDFFERLFFYWVFFF